MNETMSKLMYEAEEAASFCKCCETRGHSLGQCPHLLEWLRMKRAPKQQRVKPNVLVSAGVLCLLLCGVYAAIYLRWFL